MLKTDNHTFQEYAGMHLMLTEACDNCAGAVLLYLEKSPQHRLLNPSLCYTIGNHIRETGTVGPSVVGQRR